MATFVNIGYGNIVNFDKALAVINSDSAPAKRMIQTGKEEGSLIDGTQGRKTKSVIILDSGHIVLSTLQPDTLAARFENGRQKSENSISEEGGREDE